MEDPRQQYGDHTWDIVITYECCPSCGYIIENREKYLYQSGIYQRDFVCNQCHKPFIVSRVRPPDWPALLRD